MNSEADKPSADQRHVARLKAYEEVCKSFHAIDDFRMKLLGLLPLASLIGIFLLDFNKVPVADQLNSLTQELIGFAGIFAASLTLALFVYEIRGIRRCHNLIQEGQHLEEQLGIGHGQFHVCAESHDDPQGIMKALNAKLAACLIYSLVFSAWLFIALRFGFAIGVLTCWLAALIIGGLIALISYWVVLRFTPA